MTRSGTKAAQHDGCVPPMIRLAIVNRGEPALRALNTLAELDGVGGVRYHSIALYTDPDRDALFVRYADEAICLGAARYLDPVDGGTKHSYLDIPKLEAALVAAKVDAVWVGWGFVAEDADFAARCEELGIIFIGPPSGAMRALGDKVRAKTLAQEAGVPVGPWWNGPITSRSHVTIGGHGCVR